MIGRRGCGLGVALRLRTCIFRLPFFGLLFKPGMFVLIF